jgi:hypothetical protein
LGIEERRYSQEQGASAKKNALVTLYKIWSAFTKGLRHTFIEKQKSVIIPKLGSFNHIKSDDMAQNVFLPS